MPERRSTRLPRPFTQPNPTQPAALKLCKFDKRDTFSQFMEENFRLKFHAIESHDDKIECFLRIDCAGSSGCAKWVRSAICDISVTALRWNFGSKIYRTRIIKFEMDFMMVLRYSSRQLYLEICKLKCTETVMVVYLHPKLQVDIIRLKCEENRPCPLFVFGTPCLDNVLRC